MVTSRNSHDLTPEAGATEHPSMRAGSVAALALGLAFVLGAGEAAAYSVCPSTVLIDFTSWIACGQNVGATTDVHIAARNPNIETTNRNEAPITSERAGSGGVTIDVQGGSLTAHGEFARAILVHHYGSGGNIDVRVKDVAITTTNSNGNGIYVLRQAGTGNSNIKIDVSGGSITTTRSQGITAHLQVSGAIDIDAKDVGIKTDGANALGIFGYQQGPTGDVDVDVQGGFIETNGFLAHGVYSGKIGGTGNADVSVLGASVTTRGRFTRAVNGISSGEGDVTVDVSGEAFIVAEGEGSVGVYLLHVGNGSGHTTIGAETRVAAPFSNGVYGRLMPSANAAGRIVIDARGQIEARDTGILAWAEPRSGSTFGEGNEAADETAGTAPMIHVVSSGDITVGERVMNDYIHAAVAGDGTLSAGERAVLDEIMAGDEDALTTALAALPDDYNDAWKTRMRAFLAARGAKRTDRHGSQGNAPGANARLAEEKAVEILDIPHAGIRAMALSHTEIADYIRRGGLGGSLSEDEQKVLEAVLRGGDLEAALAALPAAYTNSWKDGVRLRAMSYNAGDIQVDVTGGTIKSEGDGVHARYVVTHDRNGAIAVTVADGAQITGERHGIFVGGAGLAAGNDDLLAQTVTVNGVVTGGTGAGVHLAGGGTVTVGETGRVIAGEGDAIRSEAGNLLVSVAGTVEGDIRAMDGALTFASLAGSEVTGTVHDPIGPLTVAGSVGRLLYTGGGTVTVAATGRLTGVDGEPIRSETGDLSVSVAGMVEGDIRATDGTLTFASMAGSEVTGTVHDPVGPLTVAGSIGRLLYTNGGTVTVAATGRLTGVDGEPIRSETGDLSVSVAGAVEGDIRATDGTLTFASMAGSRVTGTVHDPIGPLTVAGSVGRLLYTSGGTVTVAPTGRLIGVAGETTAIQSDDGDLAVTVAGMVEGDIRGSGDGDLTAMVTGTVDGDILGLSDGDHVVTVPVGGTVTGTVRLAGSTVTVGGTVGRVTLDNSGMVMVAQTGRVTGVPEGGHSVQAGASSTVTNHGTIVGGIQAGARSTVTNRGMIAGEVGIRAEGGSTVVNYGTIRSTEGESGIAVDFQETGVNTLTPHPGQTIIGKIRASTVGDTVDLTVDLSNLDESEVEIHTIVNENDNPATPRRIIPPRGMGRFINAGSMVIGIDHFNTTAFALTDDVLSDLTGSIHAAVGGTGQPGQTREGTPAYGHVWAAPFGGARNQDGTDTLTDGTHYFGGGLFGVGFGTTRRVGVFAGGSTGRLDVDNAQDVDMQTIFGGVYVQHVLGDVRLDARVLMGQMEHDSTRRVPRSTATADYTSIFFSPEVGLAMDLPVTDTLHATPRLRVRYAGLFTDGFRERAPGTNWDLSYAKRTVQILEVRGEVGVPIPLEGGGRLVPRMGLEGRYLLAGESVEATVPGGAFRVAAGGDTSVGTGTAGFGMTLPVADATTLVGNFDGALTTEHAWRATGYLGLTYSF